MVRWCMLVVKDDGDNIKNMILLFYVKTDVPRPTIMP